MSGHGHPIWIAERGLLAGDVVTVGLNDACDIGGRGKTVAALYADAEAPFTRFGFYIRDEQAAEIRARPYLHKGFIVRVEASVAQ